MTFFKSLQKPFAKKAMTCVKASLGRVYSRFFKSSSPGVGSDFHMQTLRETFEKSSQKPISHKRCYFVRRKEWGHNRRSNF